MNNENRRFSRCVGVRGTLTDTKLKSVGASFVGVSDDFVDGVTCNFGKNGTQITRMTRILLGGWM